MQSDLTFRPLTANDIPFVLELHNTGAFEDLCIYGMLRREFEASAG